MEKWLAITEQYQKYELDKIILDMASGTREVYPRRLNKGFSFDFPVGYTDRYTPGGGRRAHRPKRCDNNQKDEDNSLRVNNYTFFINSITLLHLNAIFSLFNNT